MLFLKELFYDEVLKNIKFNIYLCDNDFMDLVLELVIFFLIYMCFLVIFVLLKLVFFSLFVVNLFILCI